MRLAIVGSHKLTKKQYAMAEVLVMVFLHLYDDQPDIEVVSGGAEGVDAIAKRRAQQLGTPYVEFLPECNSWEDCKDPTGLLPVRKGYRTRNIEIVDYCTHMLCIRAKDSKTYGSGWTADLAEKRGRVAWRYYV